MGDSVSANCCCAEEYICTQRPESKPKVASVPLTAPLEPLSQQPDLGTFGPI